MKSIKVVGLLWLLTISSQVQAGFIFEFDQPNYTDLTAGSTLTTNLYVRATAGEAFTALQGVSFNMVGSGGDTTIASWTINPQLTTLFGTGSTPTGLTLNQSGVFGNTSVTSARATVGSLSFTVGSVGSTTTYVFNDPNPGNVDNVQAVVGGVSTPLDSFVFASPSISISAVPEPSSFGLLGLIGLGLVRSRFRRK